MSCVCSVTPAEPAMRIKYFLLICDQPIIVTGLQQVHRNVTSAREGVHKHCAEVAIASGVLCSNSAQQCNFQQNYPLQLVSTVLAYSTKAICIHISYRNIANATFNSPVNILIISGTNPYIFVLVLMKLNRCCRRECRPYGKCLGARLWLACSHVGLVRSKPPRAKQAAWQA